jgi:hypothetical protein
MNHAKRNPGIPKRPNPQKNAKVVLAKAFFDALREQQQGIVIEKAS